MNIKGNTVEIKTPHLGVSLNENVDVAVDLRKQPDDAQYDVINEALAVIQERKLPLNFNVATGSLVVGRNVELATPEATDKDWLNSKEFKLASKQLPTAHEGYVAVLADVNESRKKNNKVEIEDANEMEAEFKEWFTPEKLEAYEAINPGIDYDVIATPNEKLSRKDLYNLANAFGKDQPEETYINDNFYDKYTDEELAGTDPDNGKSFMFSLIPREYTPNMEKNVDDQNKAFDKLHHKHPDAKVPSPFEAVTRWYTLRAQGEDLKDDDTFDLTYTRHFDLPKKRFAAFSFVPLSYVRGAGQPYLGSSGVGNGNDARVSVG